MQIDMTTGCEWNKAAEGYKAAMVLIQNQSRILWDSFRSCLATNAILISLMGVVYKVFPEFKLVSFAAGCLGIACCVIWSAFVARSFGYHDYYYAWGRHYEKLTLGGEDEMLQKGDTYAKGDGVTIDGCEMRQRMLARGTKVRYLMQVVIWTFAALYGMMLVVSLLPPTK